MITHKECGACRIEYIAKKIFFLLFADSTRSVVHFCNRIVFLPFFAFGYAAYVAKDKVICESIFSINIPYPRFGSDIMT